jgi:hypothetical protein
MCTFRAFIIHRPFTSALPIAEHGGQFATKDERDQESNVKQRKKSDTCDIVPQHNRAPWASI